MCVFFFEFKKKTQEIKCNKIEGCFEAKKKNRSFSSNSGDKYESNPWQMVGEIPIGTVFLGW